VPHYIAVFIATCALIYSREEHNGRESERERERKGQQTKRARNKEKKPYQIE